MRLGVISKTEGRNHRTRLYQATHVGRARTIGAVLTAAVAGLPLSLALVATTPAPAGASPPCSLSLLGRAVSDILCPCLAAYHAGHRSGLHEEIGQAVEG